MRIELHIFQLKSICVLHLRLYQRCIEGVSNWYYIAIRFVLHSVNLLSFDTILRWHIGNPVPESSLSQVLKISFVSLGFREWLFMKAQKRGAWQCFSSSSISNVASPSVSPAKFQPVAWFLKSTCTTYCQNVQHMVKQISKHVKQKNEPN